MELIVQPAEGIAPLITAVDEARKSIDLLIFRFDLKPVERAIADAVKRGVAVRALIAHTNSGGEKRLRQLEMRLLEAGVTVTRTSDELVRYHGKMMVVDREVLHVLGFNYTSLDLRSRSFGLITRDRKAVAEALRLFEADCQRHTYEPTAQTLVVSPENAREQLAAFIQGARKQLWIWDPKVSDPQMVRLIQQRLKDGVDVRIVGRFSGRRSEIRGQTIPERLHVRAILRDGHAAFIGSQSLRALELDGRREIGIFVHDAKLVERLVEEFEADWSQTEAGRQAQSARDAQESERVGA